MARPMKPLVRGGGYYPSNKWTPLVYNGGYTTMSGGEEPEPPTPVYWKTITGVSPLALANALAEHIRSLTQYGKCVQDGTPTPDAPVDIMCNNGALKWDSVNQRIYADGTPEVLTVSGINLIDPSTSNITIGELVDSQGQSATSANNWRTNYIPVVGGKTYAFWGRAKADNTISAYCRMNFYKSDKTAITPRPSYARDTVTVATAPSNAAFVRLSSAPHNSSAAITRDTFDEYNWMFAEAAQEIPFEPYVTPQTVTDIPMLLGVGDYKDEAELISGLLTHKIGAYVFTGEEAFTKGSAFYTTNTSFLPSKAGGITPICTHFRGISSSATRVADSLTMTVNGPTSGVFTGCVYFYADRSLYATADDFKAFLAAQYAAGTPVIIVYPLATETTEQTTPHSLHSYEGTTVVEADTNVDPVTLSVEYASSEEE